MSTPQFIISQKRKKNMADMSLDNYIAKAGYNKTRGQKRVNMTSNNPRLHVLTSQRRGLMKRSQINRGGATMRRKMSDINKIMAPASASTKSTLKTRISGPRLSAIDARQKLVKTSARNTKQNTPVPTDARQKLVKSSAHNTKQNTPVPTDARQKLVKSSAHNTKQNTPVPTDARQKIIGKTKQVDARTKIRSGSQKRAPGLAPSAIQPVKSILRSATAIVRPLIQPITFTTALTTKSGLISRTTVVPKTLPNAVKPSEVVKLTRTVNNEAETEITTQGLIQRTLNTKVASDSVVIVESDLNFTITKPSLPKQARFDDNFMITKPNYQAKKITPPESAITMEVMNDMYHVTRKRPMRSSVDDMASTQATYQRIRPNVIRLRTAAPPLVHSVTGRELRRQTSGTDQPLLLSDIVNRPLPTTLNQASPEDDEHVDLTAIDTSIRFTVGTNNETVKPAPPSVNRPSSGPLKLYRPPKDESLPAQIAKYTAGGDTRTKHSSIPSNAPSKLSRPASGAALTTAAARSNHPPKLKSHPVLNAETNTTDPDILSPLQGYRIVVTNLHPVVNQDDVIELFGSVGSLKKAQLLKPGHANIVYQDKESAISAVRKFHSRELDGQPMQVKLVTSLTATTSGSKGMSAEVKALIAKSEKNEDSLPTPIVNPALIQRALFKTGAVAAHTRPVTFTVKI